LIYECENEYISGKSYKIYVDKDHYDDALYVLRCRFPNNKPLCQRNHGYEFSHSQDYHYIRVIDETLAVELDSKYGREKI
jgi:hypothetical protein